MVKRFLTTLNKEIGGLQEAALLLAFFTFVSQLLGLLRDRALAHNLGAGAELDIYYAAFRIPDFIFVSVASLVSINVLIPFFLKRFKKNHEEARKFLNEIFTGFLILMAGISIILFFLLPVLAPLAAPGFNPEQLDKMVNLARVMLLSPIFLGFSNLVGTVTQVFRKFFIYALSPVFYNLGIIFGVLVLYPRLGAAGLAWGVALGALGHFLMQVPAVAARGFIPRLTSRLKWPLLKNVALTSLPRAAGLALNNFSLLVMVALASSLLPGSISIFSFAKNLQAVPLALIGISFSVAAFPTLARLAGGGNSSAFAEQFEKAARQIIFWALPFSILLIILRAQIVRVVLGSGQFDWAATRLTAAAVALFALSVLAQSLLLLTVRGYYAAGRTRRPLIINAVSTLITIILAAVFIGLLKNTAARTFLETLLRVRDLAGTEILALPLAYSLGTIMNTLWLLARFRRDFIFNLPGGRRSFLRQTFFETLAAALAAGAAAFASLRLLAPVFNQETFWGIFGQGFLAGLLGMAVAVGIFKLMKSPELAEIERALKTRFSKILVFGPSSEEL